MTASSPCALGMIETRKSMVLPRTRSRKRPSCGTRFSAMSSSAITLMREMIALCDRLAIGRLAGCSTPSMRYLTITASSWVSMWMSLARRWIAVNTIESTSRMIGLLSLVSRSTVMSSLESSSLRTWIWKLLGGLVEHPLRALALLQDRLDRRAGADHHPHRRAEQHRQLVDHRQVGRIRDDDHQGPAVAAERHEAVAQHQVGGDGPEQLLVDAEESHVEELEPVALGEPAGVRFLVLAAAVGRQRRELLGGGQGLGVERVGGRGGVHGGGSGQRPITDDSWNSGR